MSEKVTIIAARVDGNLMAKGSKLFKCSECEALVWLAPSGQQKHAEGNPIVCLTCFVKRAGNVSVDDFCPISDEVRREVREFFGYDPHLSIDDALAWARRESMLERKRLY